MDEKMEDGLRYFTDMVDEKLQPILSPETAFPPIKFRPLEEYFDKYFGLSGENLAEEIQKDTKYAFVRSFVGDIIYVNENYWAGRIEKLEPYKMAHLAMHEATHSRLTSRDVVSQFADQSLATAMLGHPIIRFLNDGLAECLPLQILGTGQGKTTSEFRLQLDNLVLTKVHLIDRYLKNGQDPTLFAEIEQVEADVFTPTEEPYYYGSVFLHALSKYLGDLEAIQMVINPFKEGTPLDLETSSVPKDVDLFRITIDDIKNPHKYLEDKL